MGYFSLAVYTTTKEQSVDDLLAPYNKSVKVAPYVADIIKAQLIHEERNLLQQDYTEYYTKWKKDPAGYEAKCKNSEHIAYLKTIPVKMKFTDEELYQKALEQNKLHVNQDGDVLSACNPVSKWDWWTIGGLLHGELITKNNKHCDAAFVRDLDFEAMRLRDAAMLTPYEEAMTNGFYTEEYMRESFPTEEEYLTRRTAFSTESVIMPDGRWYEPGKMSLFSASPTPTEDKRTWDDTYYV